MGRAFVFCEIWKDQRLTPETSLGLHGTEARNAHQIVDFKSKLA